jgi:branched-chain amino acid transport system ATP-binding protein
MLALEDVTVGYGDLPVAWGINLRVSAGEVVAVLGPNGAGKSTVLLTVAGLLRPLKGNIYAEGRSITSTAPYRLVQRGVCLISDDRSLFASLTVHETLQLIRDRRRDPLELFPELVPLLKRRGGILSGGEQQILALARVLATTPKVLLIDELSLGLAPLIMHRLLGAVRRAADEDGTAVLLVEQQVEHALRASDRGYVMQHGQVVVEDTAAALLGQRDLLRASYLH